MLSTKPLIKLNHPPRRNKYLENMPMNALYQFTRLSFVLLVLLGACSPKISNQRIDKLEAREELLEKTTRLNKLKLEIERSIVRQTKLMEDVKEINQEASESAREAQKLSTRVSRNPGDSGLANRADKASRRAASDSKKLGSSTMNSPM